MIVDFVQHQGLILAVNDIGKFLVWNIAKHHPNNQYYQFAHNISLVPAQTAFHLHPQELTAIVTLGSFVVAHNRTKLYSLSSGDLIPYPQELQSSHFKELSASLGLDESEEIICVSALNCEAIVLGTNAGNLILYSVKMDTVLAKASLWDQVKRAKETGLLASTYEVVPQITCLVCFRSGDLGLVSMDNGKIFTVEMNELRVLNEVTSSTDHLQKISKLYLSEGQDKLYSLHQNYIIEWNYKLNACLSYIQYHSPQGMTKVDSTFVVVGMHPALTLISRQAFGSSDESSRQVQLSMRGALVVRSLGGSLLGVGGSDNLVDIFTNHSRLMTLIHK